MSSDVLELAKREGYRHVRVMPTGEVVALWPFIFTVGLIVGIDETGYRTRFCYRNAREAMQAIYTWDGRGDPPGYWVKEKSRLGDRHNPRLFFGIPIVAENRA